MWAITSYFNPLGLRRRLSNYRLFRANLTIPLVTVELSFNGVFELEKKDADILIQISGAALLWQKERLLNLALKAVPTETEHIAWLDCDIILKRKDWAVEARKQLQDLNVVQVFSEAVFVNSDDDIQRTQVENGYAYVPGLMSLADAKDLIAVGSTIEKKVVRYTPGFAWAAKRGIFANHGFYDADIVGNGDALIAAALLGQHEFDIKTLFVKGTSSTALFQMGNSFQRIRCWPYRTRCRHYFPPKHGEVENRGYVERQTRLATFDFDPDIDLTIGRNGAWHWARPRPDLEEFLKSYFISRAEGE